jgi:hypothetical protein
MYPGANKPAATIRGVEDGYVVCHSYTEGSGKNSTYFTKEYICYDLTEALDKVESLLDDGSISESCAEEKENCCLCEI